MSCAKCGKKTEEGSIFCPECLEVMKDYPVKPGTPVHIPVRQETAERKQTRAKKERTPEEQISFLRKLVRWLVILVAVLTTVLVVEAGILLYTMADENETQPQDMPKTRNYTTSAVTDEP